MKLVKKIVIDKTTQKISITGTELKDKTYQGPYRWSPDPADFHAVCFNDGDSPTDMVNLHTKNKNWLDLKRQENLQILRNPPKHVDKGQIKIKAGKGGVMAGDNFVAGPEYHALFFDGTANSPHDGDSPNHYRHADAREMRAIKHLSKMNMKM